ncbi:hypothetical protein BDV3_007232 [Batrachochytrium dendrobatidis]|nr:hypothetical protein O5D80_006160 [Batrachochytrium dendrobatidis]KAK5667366.1 hypothetical protein QVD99_005972 [Batrachochytrium dendrobatidis]
MASPDIAWLITRKNSCFLVKRNGIRLSREPGNLRNLHSFKYSGIVGKKVVDISASAKGVAITRKKTTVSCAKPSASTTTVDIAGPTRCAAKSIKNLVKFYRGDLLADALARTSRILESKKTPKPLKTKPVRGSRAKKL